MSNTCSYTARICGKKQNVIDFLWWLVGYGPKIYIDKEKVADRDAEGNLKWITRAREKGIFETGYIGRIGHWDARLQVKEIKNNLFVEIEDWCAWSIASSGMDECWDDDNFGQRKSIRSLCRIYGIQFEAFSEETGVGFDEYYFIDGRNEENDLYTEEDFNHDDVTEKISEDGWTLDEDKDIYWRWTKDNGKRHKEKIDRDELFYEIKNKIFPHEFRELDGEEWNFPDEPIPTLGTFCESNKNSWNIPWLEYVEEDRAARGFGPA